MAQTNFPSISANAKVYVVSIDPASTDMKIVDASVQGFIFRNIGDFPVYIKYGEACNPIIYTHKIPPNALYADDYGGLITGCVDNYRTTPGLIAVTLKL